MAVVLEAPFSLIEFALVLPDPQVGDTQNLGLNINVKRANEGTLYTYVKTSNLRLLVYHFFLPRLQAFELLAFLESYYQDTILLTNWYDEKWKVQFRNDVFEFGLDSIRNRVEGCSNENVDITLHFEGVQI